MSDLDSLFLDKRPIADMTFGAEEKTPEAQAATAAGVRSVLAVCDVKIADDINRLGCTGVVAKAKATAEAAKHVFGDADQHAPLDVAKFLRLGLAGGGVGLPCFVSPDRFCLVHETVGGLQDNQKPHHPEFVHAISRPLTDEERGKYEMVNAARTVARTDLDEAADILSGRKAVPGVVEAGEDDDPEAAVLLGARVGVQTWKCPDHPTTNWACRYCVAQAIVEGPLAPAMAVAGSKVTSSPPLIERVAASAGASDAIEACSARGDTVVELYVRVATFTRKLSRD